MNNPKITIEQLQREVRRWTRLEHKAARRRDYLAAFEYAASADKYAAQLSAAETVSTPSTQTTEVGHDHTT